MDVKFTSVKKSNLGTVPVIDGQIVAVSDSSCLYYDFNSTRHIAGCVRVAANLSGKGNDGELLVVTSGDDSGLYYWDSKLNAYVLLANKDTDTRMSFKKNNPAKSYLATTDGNSGSLDLIWNDNVYADLKNGSITAVEFHGKADASKKSDSAVTSDTSTKSKSSDKASALDVADIGNQNQGVFFKNGVPNSCAFSVKSNVPENAKFTDTTYSVFKPAAANTAGSSGLVPAPASGMQDKFLRGDGTWGSDPVPRLSGCSAASDGTAGIAPQPIKGDQQKVLTGNGSWSSLSAGNGVEMNGLSFSLSNSGVAVGTYGPMPNQNDGLTYIGEYITVPQITVDRFGRVTKIKGIRCKLPSSGSNPSTPEPSKEVSFASFDMDDDGNLNVTYDDPSTTLANFSVDRDFNLIADYNYDPTPYTLSRENDHIYATSVESPKKVVNLGKISN